MKHISSIKRLLILPLAALLSAALLLPAAAYTYNPFTDVDESDWYYYDVLTAVESGLVNGKTASTFCPDEYLTYASVRFHERMGFVVVGRHHQCGNKFGRWYDMVWMEKAIGPHDGAPKPIVPFPQLG